MNARAGVAARIDRDLDLTRALLDRLPDRSMPWRPHPRSFSLAGLATHLARLPHWGTQMLAHDDYNLDNATGRASEHAARTDVLGLFDRHVAEWREAFAAATDARLASPWVLRRGPLVVDTMPRIDAIERFFLHHMIHHRGQLTVYLRLLDERVPALYGPTADDHA